MNGQLRLPSLAPRDRRALLLGTAVVLPVMVAALVVRPLVGSNGHRRAAMERERMLLARERALVAGAPRDRELLDEARRALGDAAPRLFGGTEPVTASAELARYVAALATGNGLALDRTESVLDERDAATDVGDGIPVRARADSLDKPLRVTIQAHGDAQSIVDFLRSGESGSRQIRFERVAISRGQELDRPTSSKGALTITATVSGLARFAMLGGVPLAAEPDVAAGTSPARADADALPELVLANDPFDPGRAPIRTLAAAPAARRDTSAATAPAEVRLLGTVVRGGDSFALCQLQADPPRIVRVGERLGDLVLLAIDQGRAVFRTRGGSRVELALTTPGA